jgi:flagellin-specific chaperone FliS
MATAAATNYSSRAASGLRAYAQAAEVAQSAMSPTQASVLLHERLCQELMAAKSAYRANQLDRMCRHLSKCRRVLLVLHSDIKLTAGATGPLILSAFYLHLFEKLHAILRNPSVEAVFDELIGTLRSFCDKMRAQAAV